jgi:parvulin-like peptidyl-prolyl isomerase
MKVIRTIVLTAMLCCSWRLARAELANGIRAIVHDSIVTYEDVLELSTQTEDVLRRQYAGQPELFDAKMREADKENLDKLLANELILHEFQTAGYNLPESLIDDAVQEQIKARFGDRATATKTLQARGITYEKFRQQVRERIIIQAMREKNISSGIIISPHKVETYYLAHKNDFKVEDEVKLRMIVLNRSTDTNAPDAKELASEILRKLEEGASFTEMAKVYSQGSQRAQGGDWDWVERSVLRKELADVAFALKPGQRSGIIETPEAYYLMLVEDSKTSHCKPLVEVRDQIEHTLTLEEQKRLEKQWIDRLRKKTFVRTFF